MVQCLFYPVLCLPMTLVLVYVGLTWWPPYFERAVQRTLQLRVVYCCPIDDAGWIWNLIVSFPDHCPFTFTLEYSSENESVQ